MKKLASILMAVAIMFGAGMSQARAADAKPIAAVAVASYNDVIGDINFVGALVDRPQLGAAADGLVNVFVTQGKGLIGVDKSRPWGAIFQAAGEEEPVGYLCVPITDFSKALELLKLTNTVEASGAVYKLTPNNGTKITYVKEHNGWACFSDKPESLEHIIADPLTLLSELRKNYVVSGRLFLANVPEELREKFLSGLKSGMEHEASEKKDDETDEQFAQRKKLLETAETYIARVAGDLDQINVGWALDRKTESTHLDFSVTAKPGTKTAEEMGQAANAKTEFSGFLPPDAALTFSFAGPIPEAKQQILAGLIDIVRGKLHEEAEKKPANEQKVVGEATDDLCDIFAKVVKSGKIDIAANILLAPKSATGLEAFYVADGEKLDKLVHTFLDIAKSEHPEISVEYDAETAGDIKFHKVSVPVPENADNREKLVQCIGEKIEIVVGVGKENAYFAVGRDATAKLKEAIESSKQAGAKSTLPASVIYSVEPIVNFIAAVGNKPHDRAMAKLMDTELKKTPDKDQIRLTARGIPNGGQLRIEVQGGLMRLIGRMVILKSEGKLPEEGSDDEK